MAVAFAFNIKYLSIIALPYLILRRRWNAVAGMLGGSVLFALLPAFQLGWKEAIAAFAFRWGGCCDGSASRRGFSFHHGPQHQRRIERLHYQCPGPRAGRHGFSNPQVLVAAAAVGILALAIVMVLYHVNGFSLWNWPNVSHQFQEPFRGLVALEWAGLVAVALAFSPDTNTRHLVLTVLVNALAAALLLTPRPSVPRTPALIGAF